MAVSSTEYTPVGASDYSGLSIIWDRQIIFNVSYPDYFTYLALGGGGGGGERNLLGQSCPVH